MSFRSEFSTKDSSFKLWVIGLKSIRKLSQWKKIIQNVITLMSINYNVWAERVYNDILGFISIRKTFF